MKSVIRVYNDREYLVLPPGVWSDIVTDSFWKQYLMPCEFTLKKAIVFLNLSKPFLYIIGKCKSRECKNRFQAIAEKEPIRGKDLRFSVYLFQDTRDVSFHEDIQGQL